LSLRGYEPDELSGKRFVNLYAADGPSQSTTCDACLRHDLVLFRPAKGCLAKQILYTSNITPRTFAGSWLDQKVAAAWRKRCKLIGNPKASHVRRRTVS
jgi:hypothetical protein